MHRYRQYLFAGLPGLREGLAVLRETPLEDGALVDALRIVYLSQHSSFRDPFPRPYDELPVADLDIHLIPGPERELGIARNGRRHIDYHEPLGMVVDLPLTFERHLVPSKLCIYENDRLA